MSNPVETTMPFPDAVSIFQTGFFDGLNPCAFVSVFWLIVFLSIVGKTQYRILFLGAHFVLAYFMASYLIILGLFELVSLFIELQVVLRYVQLFVALLAIVSGGIYLYDWWNFTQGQDKSKHILRYPAILYAEDVLQDAPTEQLGVQSVSSWKNPTFQAWTVGIFVAILASLWPPSFEVTRLQSGLAIPGERGVFFLMLFFYEMIFILPVVMAFALIVFTVYSPAGLRFLRGSLGAVKMAISGLLLGWGIGFIYLFR